MILGNATSAPLVQFEEDTLLPKVPNNGQSESFFLDVLSFCQQWGVMFCIVGALLCFVVAKVYKVRKNPKSQRMWRFWSYGFIFIAIFFAFLPYIALRFY
ncbi:hypothetical protein EKG37_21195 [Robertmurraya yapensis]|uniref:Uncharacterized protein n=1 Tax=Bacillus yapensis TaxID=2492960 RepID=A0A431VTQ0_9BACI|nr:hypothetical protein [Bacillus yapensis]RTR26587.1 hypothetical protein EKG37_21195 [Bacillus yapensis]TKS93762.1 hypothetical protein FAR12_21200 [Bacillus yapensis]